MDSCPGSRVLSFSKSLSVFFRAQGSVCSDELCVSWFPIETVGFSLTLGSPCIWRVATILEKYHSKTPLFRTGHEIRAIGRIKAFSGTYIRNVPTAYTTHPLLMASVQIPIPRFSVTVQGRSLWTGGGQEEGFLGSPASGEK